MPGLVNESYLSGLKTLEQLPNAKYQGLPSSIALLQWAKDNNSILYNKLLEKKTQQGQSPQQGQQVEDNNIKAPLNKIQDNFRSAIKPPSLYPDQTLTQKDIPTLNNPNNITIPGEQSSATQQSQPQQVQSGQNTPTLTQPALLNHNIYQEHSINTHLDKTPFNYSMQNGIQVATPSVKTENTPIQNKELENEDTEDITKNLPNNEPTEQPTQPTEQPNSYPYYSPITPENVAQHQQMYGGDYKSEVKPVSDNELNVNPNYVGSVHNPQYNYHDIHQSLSSDIPEFTKLPDQHKNFIIQNYGKSFNDATKSWTASNTMFIPDITQNFYKI